MGLGAAFRQRGNLDDAIHAYPAALALDQEAIGALEEKGAGSQRPFTPRRGVPGPLNGLRHRRPAHAEPCREPLLPSDVTPALRQIP